MPTTTECLMRTLRDEREWIPPALTMRTSHAEFSAPKLLKDLRVGERGGE